MCALKIFLLRVQAVFTYIGISTGRGGKGGMGQTKKIGSETISGPVGVVQSRIVQRQPVPPFTRYAYSCILYAGADLLSEHSVGGGDDSV